MWVSERCATRTSGRVVVMSSVTLLMVTASTLRRSPFDTMREVTGHHASPWCVTAPDACGGLRMTTGCCGLQRRDAVFDVWSGRSAALPVAVVGSAARGPCHHHRRTRTLLLRQRNNSVRRAARSLPPRRTCVMTVLLRRHRSRTTCCCGRFLVDLGVGSRSLNVAVFLTARTGSDRSLSAVKQVPPAELGLFVLTPAQVTVNVMVGIEVLS